MKISELPEEVKALALLRQLECKCFFHSKNTDNLWHAFDWSETIEGDEYWCEFHESVAEIKEPKSEPKHYDNSKGSLYKFCEEQDLNTYEFDIIKRVMRCRKKGLFIEDLEKTKFLIDLYIAEMKE
jgi:hypothetical protein